MAVAISRRLIFRFPIFFNRYLGTACQLFSISLSSRYATKAQDAKVDIGEMLAKPTWSLDDYFNTLDKSTPTNPAMKKEDPQPQPFSRKQFYHLLRLSAFPLPKSPEQEEKMIRDLESQLRFVHFIQDVNVDGAEALQSIRDETEEGQKEQEITLDSLKDQFAKEEVVGKRGRIRRTKNEKVEEEDEKWDPLALAPRKLGRYIVVDTERD